MSTAIKELFISYEENHKITGNMLYLTNVDDDNFLVSVMRKCGDTLRVSLNANTLSDIENFKQSEIQTVMVIRGLPLDPMVPPTPYFAKQSLQAMPLTVAVNLGLYDLLNLHPVTYCGENNGKLFRHVVPSKLSVHEKSSQGSNYTLGMHVDNCHLPLVPEKNRKELSVCPEYLSLFGVRCDLKVFTKIAILDAAIEQLDSATIEQLKQPNFILTMPDSFAQVKKYQLPILVQDDHLIYYARYDKEYTIPKTITAKEAFYKLGDALLSQQAMHQLLLPAGDFLIFKNQRVTHSRESFTPRFDGFDRWLLRLFGVNDLSQTTPVDINKPYCIAA